MCELSKIEKQMQEKVLELKQKYLESEEHNMVLQSTIKQLELDRTHSDKVFDFSN